MGSQLESVSHNNSTMLRLTFLLFLQLGIGHFQQPWSRSSSSSSSISAIHATLNLSYDDQVESITDKIKEGSEVMKQMAQNLTSADIAGISIIDEKNMVRDLAGQLSDFKSKFDSAKIKFDLMYEDTKRKNIEQQHYLSVTQNNLTALNQKKNARRIEISELLSSKQDADLDLDTAKAEFDRADRKKEEAWQDYWISEKTQEDWGLACAIGLILFVIPSIVACPGWGITSSMASDDYEVYKIRRDNAQIKLTKAEDLEEKIRLLRTSLERTEELYDFCQQISKTLRLKIQKQKLILREFGRLQESIQEFKTEVDMVQARAQSVEGYGGINLESFVQHFKNLVEYIFDEDRFIWRQTRLRMEEKVQQIFSNLLSAERDLKIFKERVEGKNDVIFSPFFI